MHAERKQYVCANFVGSEENNFFSLMTNRAHGERYFWILLWDTIVGLKEKNKLWTKWKIKNSMFVFVRSRTWDLRGNPCTMCIIPYIL